MAIGTAQPDEGQLAAARHYFIADREVTEEYNSGKFAGEALELLGRLFETHPYVVAVGGSGLYIDALCYGLDELPEVDKGLRGKLEKRLSDEGVEALAADLRSLDPDYYEEVDKSNPARVLRGLEVCMSTGKPYSSQRSGRRVERDFNIVKVGIEIPREELYARINRRVDLMMEQGLQAEARRLYALKGLNSLNTVGYRELFAYFDGESTLEEAVELIKRNSRRYAKRQVTWFGRDNEITWFASDDLDKIENLIKKFAE